MATATNKQRLVNQVFTVLGKAVKPVPASTSRPLLEEFVYAILREGTARENADQAFEALKKSFFDWNEVRVSSTQEICEIIEEFVDRPNQRSQRIIDFLQEVFETTFSFDLDGLEKKGMKQAGKTLARYQAASDFAVAWVTQVRMGGHAIPLDSPSLRTLRRLQLVEEGQDDLESIRGALEHQIPKAKGLLFVDLISTLSQGPCGEDEPMCPECPLRSSCPTGAMNTARPVLAKKPR